MERPQPTSKPTGIPRGIPRPTGLSKLPVPGSKKPTQLPTPAPTPKETIPPPRPSTVRPPVQQRSSTASLPRAPSATRTIPSTRAPAIPTPRKGLPHPSKPAATSNIPPKPRAAPPRPSSRLRRPTQPATVPRKHATEDEENHDQLGSLDGFRTASRQGFHDDTSPEEQSEPVFEEEIETPKPKKGSRPSLSDRTIESLQAVPSTPKERRRSSFYAAESPMGPPPRPSSSMSRASSISSRPGTSDGSFVVPPLPSAKKVPATARPASRTSLGGFGFTPGGSRRSVSSSSFANKLQTSKSSVPPSPGATSPSKPQASRALSARPPKTRPALGDAFAPVQKKEKVPPTPVGKPAASGPAKSSSSALREQIAAAKAAARKERENESTRPSGNIPQGLDGSSYNDAFADPFNQGPKDDKHIMRNRVNNARMDGKLNIAAMGLKTIPPEVLSMYDSTAMEESKVNWAEVVDLTRFIAADNEIENIESNVFPDKSFEELNDEEDGQGNQFGGLEFLDLHGNALSAVPLGLRRLERLTSLNLSHNKLDNSVLEVVSQIKTLKEVKLGHNAISGNLPLSVAGLPYLEVLELQSNRLLALPEGIRDLVNLRVLNVSHNQLTDLPMEALQHLPLQDLDASNNALIGSLFPLGGTAEHRTLRSLNVANNSLAALTFLEHFDLPLLQTLNVTNNHLTALQPLNGCQGLITLAAGENKISELPTGFTELPRLRHVNFSSNDLRLLPTEIANMETLESLVLAANPLQVKKYLTMTASDIKRDLRARLEPEAPSSEQDSSAPSNPQGAQTPTSETSAVAKWALKPNALLDLSAQNLSSTHTPALASFLETHDVHKLHLQSNNLTTIPPALVLAPNLRALDLSNNPFDQTYLTAPLSLPSLTTLTLRTTRLTSLAPLLTHLHAPNLQTLDLSANRLSGALPALRTAFPALTTLFASDNRFESVDAAALRGLGTVDLGSNSLRALPAEVGLLWHEGLRSLEVGRNGFRVPGFRVLEKGTEATLRWLRDRLPAAEEVGQEEGGF